MLFLREESIFRAQKPCVRVNFYFVRVNFYCARGKFCIDRAGGVNK